MTDIAEAPVGSSTEFKFIVEAPGKDFILNVQIPDEVLHNCRDKKEMKAVFREYVNNAFLDRFVWRIPEQVMDTAWNRIADDEFAPTFLDGYNK